MCGSPGFISQNAGEPPPSPLERALAEDKVVLCAEIETEIVRVLHDKFGWTTQAISEVLNVSFADVPRVEIAGHAMGCRDADDDKVLDCAVVAEAAIIVSGDKDLLSLDPFRSIRIVTPAAYLGGVEL